jgi:U4/U6.U5 tri-snRNP-associated protein 1
MSEINPTGQWKESLSLEETNKVRISLGLKPLKDPNPAAGPTDEERVLEGDELAEHNFRKKQEKERRELEEKELGERLERARNQKERGKKLTGRGLGEEESSVVKRESGLGLGGEQEEGDTKSWIKKQKKRAKELAAKRAKEQEEMDRLAEEEEESRVRGDRYGEKDLKGIKVSHGADAFEEGEEHVLTLKDSKILDDEGMYTGVPSVLLES